MRSCLLVTFVPMLQLWPSEMAHICYMDESAPLAVDQGTPGPRHSLVAGAGCGAECRVQSLVHLPRQVNSDFVEPRAHVTVGLWPMRAYTTPAIPALAWFGLHRARHGNAPVRIPYAHGPPLARSFRPTPIACLGPDRAVRGALRAHTPTSGNALRLRDRPRVFLQQELIAHPHSHRPAETCVRTRLPRRCHPHLRHLAHTLRWPWNHMCIPIEWADIIINHGCAVQFN